MGLAGLLKRSSKKEYRNSPTVIDAISALPRHTSKKWKKRNPLDINLVVVHQTAGSGEKFKIAKYHTSISHDRDGDGVIEAWERNHISDTGCPGICYTYGIEKDGQVYLMNELEDITWHVKNYNNRALGICVFGNFSGPSWDGTEEPTQAQKDSLNLLLTRLQDDILKDNPILTEKFKGHCELDPINKENCPGTVLMKELNAWRNG